MVISRVGSLLLVAVSVLSFALVYLLNADETALRFGFLRHVADQLLQASAAPAIAAGDKATAFMLAEDQQEETVPDEALPVPTAAHASIFRSEEQRDGFIRRTLVVGRGETLTSRLIAAGITRTEALMALEALRQRVNPQKIRGGQEVVVLFRKDAVPNMPDHFIGIELHAAPAEIVTVLLQEDAAQGNHFVSSSKIIQPEHRRFAMRGAIDGSLYDSGKAVGIPASILNTIIKTYSYNIDFQRDIKPGDRFEVLFEQLTDEHGQGVGEPTLIYSALQVNGAVVPIYRVAMPNGNYEYFDAKGESIRKGLLRTPVEGARVTSGFGMRMHPILGYSRMHKGIDFGAPYGTPIYAAGAGIVEEAGFHNGYGRYVRIRHNNRLSTAYAHMSRFGRGITRGSRVAQGEIIGYVGSSGESTGSHLHYEVLVENEQVNPLTVNIAVNAGLSGRQLVAFQDWRGKVHTQFEQLIAANEAGDKAKLAQNNKAQ